MINRRIIRGFLILISLVSLTFGDETPDPPMEWGEISKDDFKIVPTIADTNASALILCDYGELSLNDNFDIVYKKHIRIKILNQRGFRFGTHSVSLYEDVKNGDILDEVEGITYAIDASGDIEEHEMDDKDVYREKIDNTHTRVKFTLPALQPGCIIEYRYTIIAQSLFGARGWVFQCDEPVLWSEYRILHPRPINFAVVKSGYEPYAIEETIETRRVFSGQMASYYGDRFVKCYLRRWVVKNAPALRDEPYITCINDYFNRIEVQLAAYARPEGLGVEQVLNTWDKLMEELVDSRGVGKRIEATGRVTDLVNQCTAGKTSPLEKLNVIYDWVASSIIWSREHTYFAEQRVNDLLDSKKGSSAEINYLLLSMLTSAGIQGEPVLVSTRDHGQLWEVYPLLSQFNHVIARATIGGRTYFLDATDPHRPMNLLPSDVLGVRGLVVQPKKTEWVTIASPAKSISALAARILIDGNGAIRGSIEGRYENYINLSVRKDLKDKKQNDVVKDLFKLDGSGLSLDSAQVNNTDSISSSTVIKAWISSDSYVQTGGDLLYLNPHLVRRWTDNIFKSEARKFPVDYNYPREYSTTVTITLPDTLEVKEVLQNRRISVEGNVIYMREMAIDSPQIILTTKLNVISKVVPARHYKSLKDLYATMISTEGEQLILQKKPKPVVVPEPIKVESKKTPDMPKKIKVKR